jgi:hypothetical protein
LQGLAVGVDHGQGAGVQLAAHLELVHGARPLPINRQQLEQEDAQLHVGRLRAHTVLQVLQGQGEVAQFQGLLGRFNRVHGGLSEFRPI